MDKTVFNRTEAAERLGVNRWLLLRWEQQGKIKASGVRTGRNAGQRVYTAADIETIRKWMNGVERG